MTTPAADTSRLVRNSATVAVGTGLSRLTGLVRVGALAWALGRSRLADVYNLANLAPNLFYELVLGGILSATLVPLFIEAREHPDDDASSVLMSVSLSAVAALTAVALGLTALVDAVFRSSMGPRDLARWDTGIGLLYLLLPQILFYGLTTLATAALNAHRVFRAPAFTPVLTNLVASVAFVIAGTALGKNPALLGIDRFDRAAVLVLGLGTTGGIAAMALPLVESLRRHVKPFRWRPDWRHPVIARMARLSGWTVGYVVANQIALVVVTIIVAGRGEGMLTAYQLAFVFFQLPHGLFAVSLMTTVLPDLADSHVRDDIAAFRETFLKGLRLVLVVIVPAAMGYVVLSRPLVSMLLERGAFESADAVITGRTLAAFAVGLPGFSVYLYALRAFYARKDTRRPFLLNVAENTANITVAVAIALLTDWGAAGIALAFSAAYTLSAVLAIRRLGRVLGGFGPTATDAAVAAARMFLASALMGVTVALAARTVGGDHGSDAIARVAAGTAVGVATYVLAAAIMHVPELNRLTESLMPWSRRDRSANRGPK